MLLSVRTIFMAKGPLPDLCCLGLEMIDLQAAVRQGFRQSGCLAVMLPVMCCGKSPIRLCLFAFEVGCGIDVIAIHAKMSAFQIMHIRCCRPVPLLRLSACLEAPPVNPRR